MDAELLAEKLRLKVAQLQSQVAIQFAGNERPAVIEIFRALDMVAFAFNMAPNRIILRKHDHARHFMLIGAATALQPFLRIVATSTGGMPWCPSSPRWTNPIEAYLIECGRLVSLLRLVLCEKYGLSKVRRNGEKVRIEVASDDFELEALVAMGWLIDEKLNSAAISPLPCSKRDLKNLRRRLDKKSGTDMGGWFIRYSGDQELLERCVRRVKDLQFRWHESEALPEHVIIGDRPFGQWKGACEAASAAILHHIEIATRLKAKHPKLELRDLLTMFLRREDAVEVWQDRGIPFGSIPATMKAMTLDRDTVDEYVEHFETPLPFFVDMGREFLLAPSLSALINPFVDVARHLKRFYRRDWDRSIDLREAAFRDDLAALFPPPDFCVVASGVALRRPEGSLLTNIDAVIVDQRTGTIALVQLKWHDVFARSIRERESRKRNLLAANQWVDRVSDWVGDRSSSDVAKSLGLLPNFERQAKAPVLLVVARYGACFCGEAHYDSRSAWLSWAELARSVAAAKGSTDILRVIAREFRVVEALGMIETDSTARSSNYRVDDICIELITNAW